MSKFLNISTDNTLGGSGASDEVVSSQKAIKAYVDSQTGTAPAFANITGQPTDNTNLATALAGKVPTSRTINSKALTSDITLTASDVGALPDSTVIPTVNNATLTLTQGGITKGTFTANASSNVTIALESGGSQIDIDNDTITENTSNKLQVSGVINSRDGNSIKIWQGTEAQWINGEPTIWYYWQTTVNASIASGGNLPSSDGWGTPVYGGGNFVSIVYNGSSPYSDVAAYSTDSGVTWSSATMPTSTNWVKPVYCDGRFVAVSQGSNVSTYSTDNGATWTAGGNLPSSGNWRTPICGGTTIVCGTTGSLSKLTYSTDGGTTWNNVTLGKSSYHYVTYSKGNFIVAGGGNRRENGNIYYSPDCQTWIEVQVPLEKKQIYALGGDEDTAFIGWYATRIISYSKDGGLTWINVSWTSGPSYVDSIVGKDNNFVANLSLDSQNSIVYTRDSGLTWTTISMPSSQKWKFAYGDGIFFATSETDAAAYSTDGGATWHSVTLPASGTWRIAAYNNGKFITVMNNSANSAVFSLSCEDCYTTDETPTTSSTVYSAPSLASTYTISSVTSGAITLSDNNTYYYTQSGNITTYTDIGTAHPDWLCFINNVGVKIGNVTIATI